MKTNRSFFALMFALGAATDTAFNGDEDAFRLWLMVIVLILALVPDFFVKRTP